MSCDDHAYEIQFTPALVHAACSGNETAAGWRRLANPVKMNDPLGQRLPVGYQRSAVEGISKGVIL